LAEAGLRARAGVAGNPDLAVLAARLGDPVAWVEGSPERIRESLAGLPVAVLQPPPEWGDVFAWWGIRTVGDLARLPRPELTERLGPGAGRLWDQARGEARRLLRLVRPPAVYREGTELESGVETAAALQAWCRRFLERIVARLAGAYLAVGTLRLELGIEGHPPHRRTLRVPDPTRDLDFLLRLLETHWETFTAPGPVVSVALEAVPAPAVTGQAQLFRHSWKDPNRLADTVARLEARLGAERVGVPETGFDHRPDRFRILTFPVPPPPPEADGSGEEPRIGPPLRRFRPRRAVAVATCRGRGGEPRPEAIQAGPMQGRLGEARGPWRGSGGWWEGGGWDREEWDVRHGDGMWLRLVSEGGNWYLEGVYD
jgi:protein ImuB